MQPLDALKQEIARVSPGSDQGQFPILDLLGNLRDLAASQPDGAGLQTLCAEAWEKLMGIIEANRPFDENEVAWLNDLLRQIEELSGAQTSAPESPSEPGLSTTPEPAPEADPFPLPPPVETAPAPAAPVASVPPVAPAAPAAPAAEEELPLTLNLADDGELLREFITESREHLDNIEQGVLVLEKQPSNEEMLNTIFRAFHTFKGGAGFLNLIPVNRLAHTLESLLDLARQGKLTLDATCIELVLVGRDVLKQFLDEIEGQLNGSRPAQTVVIPTASLKSRVRAILDGDHSQPAAELAAAEPVASKPAVAESTSAPPVEAAPSAGTGTAGGGGGQNVTIKVDINKLDGLLDLVGEMVIAQSLVGGDLERMASLNPQSARNVAQLSRITKELQRVSMSLRMVPIGGAFKKMARVVRDIASKHNKQVNFITQGEDTELDRTLVESLNDPLLHMIRNAMDHGIESPEKRAAAGKTPIGTLHLRAHHQGGNIVIEIEDDGAGLNRDRIFAKAVERGLATPDDVLSDAQVFDFIFAPGFSTVEKVTDLSGRGVGMDVVCRNIEQLRGNVTIASTPGQGTKFTINLPLTLAIIDGLVVGVGSERYIVPTLSVRESFRPTPDMISRVHNRAELVNVRGQLIPLLRLHEIFSVEAQATDPEQGIVVVVQSGSGLRCLLVDALLHIQEVVIKNLNEMMVHKNPAFAGAAILGDGRVGLILDVNALSQQGRQLQPAV